MQRYLSFYYNGYLLGHDSVFILLSLNCLVYGLNVEVVGITIIAAYNIILFSLLCGIDMVCTCVTVLTLVATGVSESVFPNKIH